MQDNPFELLGEYDLRHLPEHLERADLAADLHHLLGIETSGVRNAWWEVKEARIGAAEYTADVRRAWELAAMSDDGIGLECRYAVILSTLNSLAGNIPPVMLGALVEHGLWSINRAVAYARRYPVDERRTEAMVRLLPALGEKDRQSLVLESLSSIRAVHDQRARAKGLEMLVSATPDPRPRELFDVLFENLETAKTPDDLRQAGAAVLRSAGHLPVGEMRRAMEIFKRVDGTVPLALKLKLPEPERSVSIRVAVQQARRHFNTTKEPGLLALTVAAVGPYLAAPEHQPLAAEAFAAVVNVRDVEIREVYLADLVPWLTGGDLELATDRIVNALRSAETWGDVQTQALLRLVEGAPEQLTPTVLTVFSEISDRVRRADVMCDVICRIGATRSGSLVSAVLSELRSSNSSTWTADTVEKIAAAMTGEQAMAALEVLRDRCKGVDRIRALAAIAPVLAPEIRISAVEEAMRLLPAVINAADRNLALERLVPLLGKDQLLTALSLSERIQDSREWVVMLSRLGRYLEENDRRSLWRFVMGLTEGLEHEYLRIEFLRLAEEGLPPDIENDALAVARAFEQPAARAQAMATLAILAGPPRNESLIREAVTQMTGIADSAIRLRNMVRLIGAAPEGIRAGLVTTVLRDIDVLQSLEHKAPLFVQISRYLPPENVEQWLVREIQKPQPYGRGRRVLETLAPCMPANVVRWLLLWMRKPDMDWERWFEAYGAMPKPEIHASFSSDETDEFAGYQALVRRLAQLGHLDEAWGIATEQREDTRRAAVTCALADLLPPDLLRSAFEFAMRLPPESYPSLQISGKSRSWDEIGVSSTSGANARDFVTCGFCGAMATVNFDAAFEAAKSIRDPEWSAEALIDVTFHAPTHSRLELWLKAFQISAYENQVTRARLLDRLVEMSHLFSASDSAALVRNVLQSECGRGRTQLVATLCRLAPVLAKAENGASTYAFRSIRETVQWWP
jgi:hypothetical protein